MRRGALIFLTGFALFACARQQSQIPPNTFETLAKQSLSQLDGEIQVSGLKAGVEILRDEWGVPHIYAQNVDDLFFAEGFVVAQDRLWQMELWRRSGEGTVSEIAGAAAVQHDRLMRLLKYRGPWDDKEWTSYHPLGKRIFEAYAAGVNAFINASGEKLPVEFKLTGIRPTPWKPEDLVLRARVGDTIDDARAELRLARSVAELGAQEANRRAQPEPWDDLVVPDGLDVSIITETVLKSLDGDMYGNLPRPELLPEYRKLTGALPSFDFGVPETSPGSNNWAVRGMLTATGKAFMVDDPHRQVTNPAHRYIVHLNAPGWNVVGATEAGLAGVIRGHNGHVAWGRTATQTDQADVYVEEVNPANPNEVRWNGKWDPLKVIPEEIAVRGEAPRKMELKFSRHGPIFYEDYAHHRAYALRSQLQERGTAEYLGGLRLDQAAGARDCLKEADFMPAPPTNLVCADAEGNIAFRIAAFAPKRNGWNARLPVPGTGKYEWAPERRRDLPSLVNPPEGFIATANNNTQPPGFKPPYAFLQAGARYRRHERLVEMLKDRRNLTLDDMMTMLRDSYNSEAAENKAYFHGWRGETENIELARAMIAAWNSIMDKNSPAAALYMTWQRSVDMKALRGARGPAQRAIVTDALKKALDTLTKSQGPDPSKWRWGAMNRSEFPHPLLAAYDLPAVERQGGAGTVNAIGAVYRLITNFADLDKSMVTIAPGMSGQPGSPYYSNLLDMWNRNQFFPLLYSRSAVESRTKHKLVLKR